MPDPRYEARELGPASLPESERRWGIYDIQRATWVWPGDEYRSFDNAYLGAARLNAAYERAMTPLPASSVEGEGPIIMGII